MIDLAPPGDLPAGRRRAGRLESYRTTDPTHTQRRSPVTQFAANRRALQATGAGKRARRGMVAGLGSPGLGLMCDLRAAAWLAPAERRRLDAVDALHAAQHGGSVCGQAWHPRR